MSHLPNEELGLGQLQPLSCLLLAHWNTTKSRKEAAVYHPWRKATLVPSNPQVLPCLSTLSSMQHLTLPYFLCYQQPRGIGPEAEKLISQEQRVEWIEWRLKKGWEMGGVGTRRERGGCTRAFSWIGEKHSEVLHHRNVTVVDKH